jgi:hypothetical protein
MGRFFSFQSIYFFSKILTHFIQLFRTFGKAFVMLLVICTFACSNHGSKKTKLVPQKDFINLLVDMHLADGLLQHDYSNNSASLNLDSTSFYNGIFHKYGVTKMNFDSTVKFYSLHPKDFDYIYGEVVKKLSRMEGELSNQQKKLDLKSGKKNLWKSNKNWRFPKDGKNLCLSFSIPVKQLGNYRISGKIKMYTDDKSVNTRMIAWYWYKDSTKLGHYDYFKPKAIAKNGSDMVYSISKELKDPKVTHIQGFIIYSDNLKSKVLRHIEVHELEVMNISSTPANR